MPSIEREIRGFRVESPEPGGDGRSVDPAPLLAELGHVISRGPGHLAKRAHDAIQRAYGDDRPDRGTVDYRMVAAPSEPAVMPKMLPGVEPVNNIRHIAKPAGDMICIEEAGVDECVGVDREPPSGLVPEPVGGQPSNDVGPSVQDEREEAHLAAVVAMHRRELLAYGQYAEIVHPEDLPVGYRPGMKLMERVEPEPAGGDGLAERMTSAEMVRCALDAGAERDVRLLSRWGHPTIGVCQVIGLERDEGEGPDVVRLRQLHGGGVVRVSVDRLREEFNPKTEDGGS